MNMSEMRVSRLLITATNNLLFINNELLYLWEDFTQGKITANAALRKVRKYEARSTSLRTWGSKLLNYSNEIFEGDAAQNYKTVATDNINLFNQFN